jgi:hypothetical protein
MTSDFGFEVGPSEVYEDRLEELLDRLELPQGGAMPFPDGSESDRSTELFEFDTETTPSARFGAILKQRARASALDGLRGFALSSYLPTIGNAVSILKLIGQYHEIPWRIGYTILEHEGGVELFEHHDGVMQSTSDARKDTIPNVPRDLKLALLGLPPGDLRPDATLNQMLHGEFPRRLAVQIATGMQEIKDNLQKFSGYVALAWQAYNAGAGWGFYTVTAGQGKQRPRGVSDTAWENMCRYGASLLHQLPGEVRVGAGVWQCDANMPGWHRLFQVKDRTSGLTLVSYHYLRSINACIQSQHPNIPCDQAHHKQAGPGSGQVVCSRSRAGALDKLYNPAKLRSAYYNAVRSELEPVVPEDSLPLKVVDGQLVKMPLVSSVQEISGDIIREVFPELLEEAGWGQGMEFGSVLSEGAPRRPPACRPPIVLDGFRTGEYTLRIHHYARMLPLPLPAPIIVIRGHTDNQGNTASNQGLSLSRAFEVLQWLTHRNGEKQIGGRIIIEALGATAPVASNATEDGRIRNRRVEILLCQTPPPPPVVAGAVRIQMGARVA